VEKDTSTQASFSSAKVVIDTLCLSLIEDEAIIHIEGKGFRVLVFEAKTEFTIIHTGPLEEEVSSSSMKIKCSQRVVDMEFNGKEGVQVDLANDDLQKEHNQDEVQGVGEDEQSPFIQMNSNSNCNPAPEVGQHRDSPNGTINSVSRTKTASFSQNGSSEEAIKLSMEKDSLGDEVVTSSLIDIVLSKDVMKPRRHYVDHSSLNKDDCLSPPGFERTSCQSIEPPSGFEAVDIIEPLKKAPGRPQQLMERRVTRSQKKREKSNSQLTSESIKRIAKESLEIGKIF